MTADERRILEGLRQAEAAAFDEAYRTYRPRIYSYLCRMTRDRSVAEDLLQETWLRLARHATRLAAETELSAWLFTVAHHLAVSQLRWRLIDFGATRAMSRPPALDPVTPFDLASASETVCRVEAALGALPRKYREVALLVLVEGFQPTAAARVLGVSAEAVRQRLARARYALSEALGAARGFAQTGGTR